MNFLLRGAKKFAGGDDREMLVNREIAFSRGYLSDALSLAAEEIHSTAANPSILDVGGGAGSVAKQLNLKLQSLGSNAIWTCLDYSREACKLYGRSVPSDLAFVADAKEALPFDNDSFEVVLNCFAPKNFSEMMRVCKPGGEVIVIFPGPSHLQEIRAVTSMGIEPNKAEKYRQAMESIFPKTKQFSSCRTINDPEIVNAVCGMTPLVYHGSKNFSAIRIITTEVHGLVGCKLR